MALLGKYCDRFYRDALIRRFIATDGVVLVGGRRKFEGIVGAHVWIGRGRTVIEKDENRGNCGSRVLSGEKCPGIERLTYERGSRGDAGFWKRVCWLLKIIAFEPVEITNFVIFLRLNLCNYDT